MKRHRVFVLVCGLGLSMSVWISGGYAQTVTYLSAQHRAALQPWLERRQTLRLATEDDCRNKLGLAGSRQEYGREYQPYYAIGDFNRDGHEDFAVVLIDRQKRSRRFAIAVFNGPYRQHATGPAFLSGGIDLSDGGLVKRPGKPLIAGVFQSDDCVLLQPRGSTYVMKSCL